jgi:hypothetical protein
MSNVARSDRHEAIQCHSEGIVPTVYRAMARSTGVSSMKIKTNIRAGQGGSTTSGGVNSGGVNAGGASGGGKNSSGINNTVGFYVPPTTRCAGL